MECDINERLKDACIAGDYSLAEQLIEKGATDFDRALYATCEKGHYDLAKLLIKKGAKSAQTVGTGLIYACEGEHYDLAVMLIKRGVTDIHRALNITCEKGNVDLTLLLLNYRKKEVVRALRMACEKGHCEMALSIIEAFAKKEKMRLEYLLEAFCIACERGDFRLALLLIDNGVSGALNLNMGLRLACSHGHNCKLVLLLIAEGATNLSEGFEIAYNHKHFELASLLLKKGARPHKGYNLQRLGNNHVKELYPRFLNDSFFKKRSTIYNVAQQFVCKDVAKMITEFKGFSP